MNTQRTRASIRLLVFGPILKSTSFWLALLFLVSAVFNLEEVWRSVRRSAALSPSMEPMMLLLTFVLALASYVYFTDLISLRKQAQAERDEEKRDMLSRSADSTIRMFCFGAASLAIGLQLCRALMYSAR